MGKSRINNLLTLFKKSKISWFTILKSVEHVCVCRSYGTATRPPPPDLASLLLSQRIVFVGAELTSKVAELIIGELLWLNSTYLEKPIDIYINSIGTQNRTKEVIGLDNEVYAITDTLAYIRPSHYTLSIGQTLGSAVVLLASGETGKRYALPNSRIMTCPARANRFFGPLADQLIRANQLDYVSESCVEILAGFTKKPRKEVRTFLSRNKYWSPKNAIEFGIIDKILVSGKKTVDINMQDLVVNNT